MIAEKNNFTVDTPSCNTGYLKTSKHPFIMPENGLRALIDWVSVTFKNVSLNDVFQIIKLPENLWTLHTHGFNGYMYAATYKSMKIMWGTPDGTLDMGIHIDFSGEACREYEQEFNHELNWSEFFALIMNFDYKFTRLDLAIDDFKGYFTIKQLYKKGKNGCITVKRIKEARYFETFDLEKGLSKGETLYIGKGDRIYRFYDKLNERRSKGYETLEGIDFWNRYEVQLRSKMATSACEMLAYQNYDFGSFVKGILASNMDVKIKSNTDSKRDRWKSVGWWKNFLGECEKIELTQVAKDPTMQKKFEWLNNQVTKTLAMVYESFDYDRNIIDYFLEKGVDKIEKKDKQLIDEFHKNKEMKYLMKDSMMQYLISNDNYNEKSISSFPEKEKTRYQTTTVL